MKAFDLSGIGPQHPFQDATTRSDQTCCLCGEPILKNTPALYSKKESSWMHPYDCGDINPTKKEL